ncbi:MAG: energy transducer TonB [Pseudomonadota bacterium]
MTLVRWAIALGASLAVHLTVVAAWPGNQLHSEDERAAGALAEVSVMLSPSQFYPSTAAQESGSDAVEDVPVTEVKEVSAPLPSTMRRQVENSPSEPSPPAAQADAAAAPIAVPKALKQPARQKLAAISKTTPVEQLAETEIAPPIKPREETKRVKKKPAKKKPRKAKKEKGKTSKKASRGNTASSARKGTKRRKVGDGGRSSTAVGRRKLSSYLGRVASKVRRQKRYPKAALRRKKGGTAVVAFTITKRGSVTGVRLKRRSGNAALDREVLNMVRRAAPFPPIPKGTGRSRIALSIPVRFAVR